MRNLNDNDYFYAYMQYHLHVYDDPSVSAVSVFFIYDVTEQAVDEKGDN